MRPNVLFILADQHRYDAVGRAGKLPIDTPNIDRIGNEGAWFTRAFTPTPVCAPARQSLLSGYRAESLGALWNYGFIETTTLTPDRHHFSGALRDAGYHNAFFGHWDASPHHGPADFGYHEHIDMREYQAFLREKHPNLTYASRWFGEGSPLPLEDARTHYFAGRVCEAIERLSSQDAPWHIMVDITDPHLPCRPSAPFSGMYDPSDIPPWDGFGDTLVGKPYIQRQQLVNWDLEGMTWADWAPTAAAYYGMISQIDDAIGLMLAALDRAGCAGNTLVIYTSDHGDLCGSHGMIDKHYVLYDDVIRVPLAMRLPGVIVPGNEIGEYVYNCLDLAPTIEELCGIAPPEGLHGTTLAPLLDGRGQERPPHSVSCANGQQFGSYTQRSIRTDQYKYVWNLTDIDELYDLRGDPGEKTNLIAAPQAASVLPGLRAAMKAELLRCGDPFVRSGWLDRQLEGRKLVLDQRKPYV